MKILVLVLASDTTDIYKSQQTLWKTYMKLNPNVDCFFYKGNPNISAPALVGDTLYLNIEESFDTIYEKTLMAFDFFKDKLERYDYVYRTNLSSVIVFDRLLNYAMHKPLRSFCSAVIGHYLNDKDKPFPSGSGILFSRDIIRLFCERRPTKLFQDDVTFGKALREWGISIIPCPRGEFKNLDEYMYYKNIINDNTIFHFRVKHIQRHSDGIENPDEIFIMKQLIQKCYNISI